MDHKIGDKIIKYALVAGVVKILEIYEVTEIREKVIVLDNKEALYKKTLKPRVGINNLQLSRKACQDLNKKRLFCRYRKFDQEIWNELESKMEVKR